MTYAKREEIFSKDVLTIADLQELLGLTYQASAKLIREIKFKFDRLGVQGKLHVEDYLEYFKIKTDRYARRNYEID
jgi:tRNA A37 N6-isopentenylltransferase MiaA